MIQCKDVSISFQGKIVLDRIGLSIPDGAFLCLLGQSGCGKSTFLRLLAGLLRADCGSITVDGKEVDGPEKACSVVFQDYTLFPWMTTGDNLMLALRAACPDKSRVELRNLAESYLELVGLGNAFRQYPAALSGGMRQRAAIARAISVPCRILLMDEPFGALDPVNRAMLQDLVRTLHADAGGQRTVVFVTHDVDEALYLGTEIAVLGSSPGRVIALEKNPVSRQLSREKLFEQESVISLQKKIMEIYRSDMNEKLNRKNIFLAGNGI